MSFFSNFSTYTGIDVSEGFTRIASLRKSRKGYELVKLETFSLTDSRPDLGNSIIISTLPSRATLVRSLKLPIKKEKDLKNALHFQIEPLLPYPIEKALVQSQMIEKKESLAHLTAFVVRQDHIKAHLATLLKREIEPEIITCTPHALAVLTTLFSPSTKPQVLIHEGEQEMTCILVKKGKLLAARAFDQSQNNGIEIQKTLLSFSSLHPNIEINTLFLLGTKKEEIQKATGKIVLLPSTDRLALSQEDLIHYGLAIGIALASQEVNFRQKEFSYPHKWRRIKTPLSVCMTLSILLAGTFFGLGQFALKQKKQAISNAYTYLMEREGRKIDKASLPHQPFEFYSSLGQIEKEIKARPNTFPLLPATPKMSECLKWLATQPGIEIENLHYAMVKHPDFSHQKQHYKIKVELEFSANSIQAANAFHELLIAPNPFLDMKEKMQWVTNKGKYRSTFYLKDKTRYNA